MAVSMWAELANQYGAQYAVPPALILALIDMESGGDPNEIDPVSNATGLMQITSTVLKDYNERHKTAHKLTDLTDPELNVKMGVELLRRISMAYEKFNGIKPQWENPNYIGLIVAGWNAGYSKASGVSYVLSRMEAAGIPKSRWTLASMHEAAKKLEKASPYLKMELRIAWMKRVVQRFETITKGAQKRVAKAMKDDGKEWSAGKKFLVYGGVTAGVVGVGYMLLNRRGGQSEAQEAPGIAGPGMPAIIVVK